MEEIAARGGANAAGARSAGDDDGATSEDSAGRGAEPAAEKPAPEEPAADLLAASEPAAQRPTVEEAAAEKPAAGASAAEKPAAAKSAKVDADAEAIALRLWRAKQYDAAMEVLMKTYGTRILGFTRRILKRVDLAEDARAVTFSQAWRGIARYEGRGTFWAWLCAIAYHRCLDTVKQRRKLAEQSIDDGVVELLLGAESRSTPRLLEQRRALEQCLSKLDLQTRAETLMRYVEGMSFEEISDIVGGKPDAVRQRIARALPSLKKCLERKGVTL